MRLSINASVQCASPSLRQSKVSVRLSVRVSVSPSVRPRICPSVHPYMHPAFLYFIRQPIRLAIRPTPRAAAPCKGRRGNGEEGWSAASPRGHMVPSGLGATGLEGEDKGAPEGHEYITVQVLERESYGRLRIGSVRGI